MAQLAPVEPALAQLRHYGFDPYVLQILEILGQSINMRARYFWFGWCLTSLIN